MATYTIFRGAGKMTYGDDVIAATIGGIRFTYEVSTEDQRIDQEAAPVNTIQTEITCEVEADCAEVVWEVLGNMPNVTLVTDSVDATKKRIEVSGAVGSSLAETAKELKIEPTDAGRTDRVLVIPHAVLIPALSLAWDPNGDQTVPLRFKAIVTGDGQPLFTFGDQSAVSA